MNDTDEQTIDTVEAETWDVTLNATRIEMSDVILVAMTDATWEFIQSL